jgi:hypothetical protein
MTYFVNMHDTFMSGWGDARNGRSLFSIRCDTIEQAEAAAAAARERPEMQSIIIDDDPPGCRPGDHLQIRAFDELGGPWKVHYHGAANDNAN